MEERIYANLGLKKTWRFGSDVRVDGMELSTSYYSRSDFKY